MNNKNHIQRALPTITLLFSLLIWGLPTANAEGVRDKGYLGFVIGNSYHFEGTGATFDDNELLYKFQFGYHLLKYIAIEGEFLHFSEIQSVLSGVDRKSRLNGASVSVLWHLPFWKSDTRVATFFLKGGAFRWDDKTTTSTGTTNTSDVDVTAGFGVQIRGENNAAFRFEVQRYQVDKLDIDTASINFLYYF